MKFKRFTSLLVMMVLLSVLGTSIYALSVRKGPYLLFPGDNTQMTVLWQLDGSASTVIEWGTDTSYSLGSINTSEYGSDHQHRYVIPNLTPGTRYYYRVNVGGTYHTGSFNAAPASSAENVKFLAYGDTRSYPADHDAVCAQMNTTYTNDPDFQTFTLHVGDFVNDGDLESEWTSQFFGRTRAATIGLQANLPIVGCMGNHEYSGVLYEKYWPYPFEAGGRYFSYDYGPVHIAVIDQYTDYSTGSAQLNWLENDLASSTKEWKFVVLHQPGWSAGGHSNDTNVQNRLQPLFLAHRVDIVFCGHNHYYAHCDVQGVHHVTTGGGGAPLYAPSSNAEYLVYAEAVLQFCEIEIQGDQLYMTAREVNGSVIETFSVSHVVVPQLPWSDGFESGELTAGGWVASGGQIQIQTDAYSGTYAARTNRETSVEKWISTEGFTNVHVKYARKTSGLELDEFLVTEWFDGSAWHELERTQDSSWALVEKVCAAGADENRMFKLRFRAEGADSKDYTFIDAVEVFAGTSGPDTTPPTPDPMSFQTAPYATGSASISMTASTASDPSGVEYFFECLSAGGHNSNWQAGPTYEDTGLQPDTSYTYRVKARDKSSNANETAYSGTAAATTQSGGGVEMYVADIAMSFENKGPNYNGVAVVTVKDSNGNNVEGAAVYGTWSGAVGGSVQGITVANGTVSLSSAKIRNGGTFIFTVTDVVKSGVTYNSSLNVETSDSVTTN